jgi:hypothetical protein
MQLIIPNNFLLISTPKYCRLDNNLLVIDDDRQ